MRRILRATWPLLAVSLAGPAFGQARDDRQPAPAPAVRGAVAAPAPAGRRMDAVLNAWAARGANMKTLSAKYIRTDYEPDWKQITKYEGAAKFKAPNDDQRGDAGAVAQIYLRKLETKGDGAPVLDANGKPKSSFYEKVVCTGKEVYHYKGPTQQLFIYELDQNAIRRKLEEGPLPFLFDMRVNELKQRYTMSLTGENDKLYRIEIIPLTKDDRDYFIQGTVWLDKAELMPKVLKLVHPNGKDTETYEFTSIDRNVEILPQNFEPDTMKPPWTVTRVPSAQPPVGRPQAGAAAGAQPPRMSRTGRTRD